MVDVIVPRIYIPMKMVGNESSGCGSIFPYISQYPGENPSIAGKQISTQNMVYPLVN